MTDLSPDVQALLDESYESDLTEEESEELLLLCGHGIGPKLSPAAQEVLDAFISKTGEGHRHQSGALAAALRELAASNAYEVEGGGWYSLVIDVDDIYAIAAELEGHG
jgi:hypothetical protein